MKKILVLLGVMAFSTTLSHAVMNDNETTDISILRSQGYSESALKVIDTVRHLNTNGEYKSQFEKKFRGPYYYIKNYWDPIQEDNSFAEHQINFANSWNGDETRYTSKKRFIAPVERPGVENEVDDL